MFWVSIMLLYSMIFSQSFQKFIYKTKFKSFNVGTTEIIIQDNQIENLEIDENQKLITIESFSNQWIDLLYKLRHHSTLIVNSNDYSLLALTQKVQQGDYIDSYNATINYLDNIIYYNNFQDLTNTTKEESLIIPIEGKIYEPFAIVYYLQNLTLQTNQKHIFNYYAKTNIKSLQLEVFNTENIKTPYITSPCYLVVPNSNTEELLLKNKGEMKIWYTADALQLPIKIQQKMRHGIMELLLIDYVTE